MSGPAALYYESLIGDWSGTMHMRVRDPVALRAAGPFARMLGLFVRMSGRVTMSTTLRRAPAEDGRLVYAHTTTVTRLGVRALRSEEWLVLGADGQSLTMRGVHRLTLRPEEPYVGTGRISGDARAAVYEFDWMTAPMLQRTEIAAEGLWLTQETAWAYNEVLLRRRGSGEHGEARAG